MLFASLSPEFLIVKVKVLSLQCNEDKRMKKEKRNFLLNEWSKYCLDISKLIFAGVILAGIMKKDIKDYTLLFTIGGLEFIIVLAVGFILLSISHDNKGK